MSEELKELAEECIAEMIDDDMREQTRSFLKSCFAEFFREHGAQIFHEQFASELEIAISAEFRQAVISKIQHDRDAIRNSFMDSIRAELREELMPEIKEELRQNLLQRLLANPDAIKMLMTDPNDSDRNASLKGNKVPD